MPDKPPPRIAPTRLRWLLRRADQATLAALSLAALVSLAGYWVAQGGLSGRLIEIDRAEPQSARFMVDINRADWPELSELPGIGETMAKRIVDVRQTQGPFADHKALRRVPGIGQRTLERLEPYLLPMTESESVAGQ